MGKVSEWWKKSPINIDERKMERRNALWLRFQKEDFDLAESLGIKHETCLAFPLIGVEYNYPYDHYNQKLRFVMEWDKATGKTVEEVLSIDGMPRDRLNAFLHHDQDRKKKIKEAQMKAELDKMIDTEISEGAAPAMKEGFL